MTDTIWKYNYKSMSVSKLRDLELPIWLTPADRIERMAFIACEIALRGDETWG